MEVPATLPILVVVTKESSDVVTDGMIGIIVILILVVQTGNYIQVR